MNLVTYSHAYIKEHEFWDALKQYSMFSNHILFSLQTGFKSEAFFCLLLLKMEYFLAFHGWSNKSQLFEVIFLEVFDGLIDGHFSSNT